MRLNSCQDIDDLRRIARSRLPRGLFNYLDQGTGKNAARDANRHDLQALRLLPRSLVDVTARSPQTRVLGQDLAMPLIVAPAGPAGLFWYEGELCLARAAKAAGIPHILSTYSTKTAAEIASTGVSLWQQLYFWQDKSLAERIIANAEGLGVPVLMLTVDSAILGMREYEKRDRFLPPYGPGPGAYLDMMAHPRWLAGVALRHLMKGGMPQVANLAALADQGLDPSATELSQSVTWEDIGRLRARWRGKLLIKGVMRADEALRAVELGLDGIVISNHGGRNLDSAASTISALPAIAEAVKGRIEILLDSGIRTGEDIARAVSIGASAVITGRAPLYGIAAGGEAGANRAFALLRAQLDATMALCGAPTVAELTPDLIQGA